MPIGLPSQDSIDMYLSVFPRLVSLEYRQIYIKYIYQDMLMSITNV